MRVRWITPVLVLLIVLLGIAPTVTFAAPAPQQPPQPNSIDEWLQTIEQRSEEPSPWLLANAVGTLNVSLLSIGSALQTISGTLQGASPATGTRMELIPRSCDASMNFLFCYPTAVLDAPQFRSMLSIIQRLALLVLGILVSIRLWSYFQEEHRQNLTPDLTRFIVALFGIFGAELLPRLLVVPILNGVVTAILSMNALNDLRIGMTMTSIPHIIIASIVFVLGSILMLVVTIGAFFRFLTLSLCFLLTPIVAATSVHSDVLQTVLPIWQKNMLSSIFGILSLSMSLLVAAMLTNVLALGNDDIGAMLRFFFPYLLLVIAFFARGKIETALVTRAKVALRVSFGPEPQSFGKSALSRVTTAVGIASVAVPKLAPVAAALRVANTVSQRGWIAGGVSAWNQRRRKSLAFPPTNQRDNP